jgi:hypothetical protein
MHTHVLMHTHDLIAGLCNRLGDKLQDKDREKTKLLIYCTGGIRCVKVGAYLKQVSRDNKSYICRLCGCHVVILMSFVQLSCCHFNVICAAVVLSF